MKLWSHQSQAIGVLSTHRPGHAGVISTPTGGGKSVVMFEDIKGGRPCVLYTHRRMLFEQIAEGLCKAGIEYGMRAAGHERDPRPRVQLAMVQTELKRSSKDLTRLAAAERVYVDEAHLNKGEKVLAMLRHHREQGADIVGFTATPVGLSGFYEEMWQCGTNSSLRECGALVPARTYAISEPDLSKVKKVADDAYSLLPAGTSKSKEWCQQIVGDVIEQHRNLNPDGRPSILFAPGVKESMWFAREFENAGVRAAHVDGNDCYLDGELFKSKPEERESINRQLRSGEIGVLCNRFVYREGIDIPELFLCHLATPIGSVSAYCQIVGRVLRSHPSTPHVAIADYGGNWWRHGSANEDRDWSRLWSLPESAASSIRREQLRETQEPGITCPKCYRVRRSGNRCGACGYFSDSIFRRVVQANGQVKETTACPVARKVTRMEPDTEKLWTACYFKAKKTGKSMSQARGWFVHLHGYWPPEGLRFMPKEQDGWYRKADEIRPSDMHWPAREEQLASMGEFT